MENLAPKTVEFEQIKDMKLSDIVSDDLTVELLKTWGQRIFEIDPKPKCKVFVSCPGSPKWFDILSSRKHGMYSEKEFKAWQDGYLWGKDSVDPPTCNLIPTVRFGKERFIENADELFGEWEVVANENNNYHKRMGFGYVEEKDAFTTGIYRYGFYYITQTKGLNNDTISNYYNYRIRACPGDLLRKKGDSWVTE